MSLFWAGFAAGLLLGLGIGALAIGLLLRTGSHLVAADAAREREADE